jgi:chemotaxis protein histidine kinase CheA
MTNNEPKNSDSIKAAIEVLRKDYVNNWPEKRNHLETLFENLERDPKDTTIIGEFRMSFHRLAGSGGSYGLPEVTIAAREAELLIVRFLDGDKDISPETIKKIQNYIQSLDTIFTKAAMEINP